MQRALSGSSPSSSGMETKDSVAADAEEEDDGAADTIGKPALTLIRSD